MVAMSAVGVSRREHLAQAKRNTQCPWKESEPERQELQWESERDEGAWPCHTASLDWRSVLCPRCPATPLRMGTAVGLLLLVPGFLLSRAMTVS